MISENSPPVDAPPDNPRRSLFWPIAIVLPMLAVLIGLGLWQLDRRDWKQDLLARLDAADDLAPVDVATATPSSLAEFTPVTARGRVLIGTQRVGPRTLGGRVGSAVVGWLALENGRILAVERGWAPDEARPDPFGPETVTVRGWVRLPPRQTLFQPDNDPSAGRWFRIQPRAMARAAGFDGNAALPFYVQASEIEPAAERYPVPAKAPPRPADNHLQYALTWFSLAVTLLVVFAVWVRRGRGGSP